jgi:hypothetical protein
MRVDLADDEDGVAPAGDGLAHDLLGAAFAIHFGGVDEGHAEIDAKRQRRHHVGTARARFAHAPGAEPEHRDFAAIC